MACQKYDPGARMNTVIIIFSELVYIGLLQMSGRDMISDALLIFSDKTHQRCSPIIQGPGNQPWRTLLAPAILGEGILKDVQRSSFKCLQNSDGTPER